MTNTFEADLTKACEALLSNDSYLVSCHINPDGDALGSMLAMMHALKSINKKVIATFPEPFVVPSNLKTALVGTETIHSPSEVISLKEHFDVALTFDCGSKSRLSGIEGLLNQADVLINVDHHLSNERFGDINVIDAKAPSSGTVVLSILDECNIELNKEIAQCIYVALLTDTGRFQFSSTNSEVFKQASRLCEFDLPIAELSRVLTEEDSFAFLQLAGKAMMQMNNDRDSKVVSALVSIEMQKEFGVSYDQTEGLIEFVRRAKECDVACVVKEYLPNDYRVSLRSLGTIDVCEIAKSYGGGGHRYAAGFSSTKRPTLIISEVQDLVLKQR